MTATTDRVHILGANPTTLTDIYLGTAGTPGVPIENIPATPTGTCLRPTANTAAGLHFPTTAVPTQPLPVTAALASTRSSPRPTRPSRSSPTPRLGRRTRYCPPTISPPPSARPAPSAPSSSPAPRPRAAGRHLQPGQHHLLRRHRRRQSRPLHRRADTHRHQDHQPRTRRPNRNTRPRPVLRRQAARNHLSSPHPCGRLAFPRSLREGRDTQRAMTQAPAYAGKCGELLRRHLVH